MKTFSVSVDARTKRILKKHADRLFGGNMSALISERLFEQGVGSGSQNISSAALHSEPLIVAPQAA